MLGNIRVFQSRSQFFKTLPTLARIADHLAHGLDNLMAPAVTDGNVDAERAGGRTFLCGFAEGIGNVIREQAQIPNDTQAPFSGLTEGTHGLRDNRQELSKFIALSREVIGREHPQSDDFDANFFGPPKELSDFPRADSVSLGSGEANRLRPTPVSVKNYSDVARDWAPR